MLLLPGEARREGSAQGERKASKGGLYYNGVSSLLCSLRLPPAARPSSFSSATVSSSRRLFVRPPLAPFSRPPLAASLSEVVIYTRRSYRALSKRPRSPRSSYFVVSRCRLDASRGRAPSLSLSPTPRRCYKIDFARPGEFRADRRGWQPANRDIVLPV